MSTKVVMISILLGLLVASCRSDLPPNAMAGLPANQIKDAVTHAETPAGISTVEFKELGYTKRNALMARFIKSTWGDVCKPASLQLKSYSPNGSSNWEVHCNPTVLPIDYSVAVPERSGGNARVLKCYAANARVTLCSVLGPPAG